VATVYSSDPVEVVDPRYKNHCVEALLIRPDNASRPMKILRDTGALQSLVSSNVLTNDDYVITGERRLIRGITGDVVSVPLVELTVECQLCTGTYLCGLVSTLPVGIALLVGNDLCSDPVVAEVNVVTRSMTAAKANTTGRKPHLIHRVKIFRPMK